jgi:hypothetical protein
VKDIDQMLNGAWSVVGHLGAAAGIGWMAWVALAVITAGLTWGLMVLARR